MSMYFRGFIFNKDGFVSSNVSVINTHKMSEVKLVDILNGIFRNITIENLYTRLLCDNEIAVNNINFF